MRSLRFVALGVLIILFGLFTRNNAHALGRRGHISLTAPMMQQAAPARGLLQILEPKPGEKLQGDVVTVQFSMVRAADAEPTPTYEVRMDSADPIQTAQTSYTFTGLRPGEHNVAVQAVDANSTPIPMTQAAVRFTVIPPPGSAPPANDGGANPRADQGTKPRPRQAADQNANPRAEQNADSSANPDSNTGSADAAGSASSTPRAPAQMNQAAALPDPGDGSLSMLSVIGFGILVGGALSLYRGRAIQEKRRRNDD